MMQAFSSVVTVISLGDLAVVAHLFSSVLGLAIWAAFQSALFFLFTTRHISNFICLDSDHPRSIFLCVLRLNDYLPSPLRCFLSDSKLPDLSELGSLNTGRYISLTETARYVWEESGGGVEDAEDRFQTEYTTPHSEICPWLLLNGYYTRKGDWLITVEWYTAAWLAHWCRLVAVGPLVIPCERPAFEPRRAS